MATYYVKPAAQGGNNSLAGTSPSTAWATVAYALSSSSGFADSDTLYIAPGIYTDAISITMTSPTVTTNIIGDPTCSQFSGLTTGPVVLTNYNSTLSGTAFTGNVVSATSKNFLFWQKINFKCGNTANINLTTCQNWSFANCTFSTKPGLFGQVFTPPTGQPYNMTFSNCVFSGGNVLLQFEGPSNLSSQVTDSSSFTNCYFTGHSQFSLVLLYTGGFAIRNCTFIGNGVGVYTFGNSTSFPTIVRNCLISTSGIDLQCLSGSNAIVEDYNRLLGRIVRQNVAASSPSNSTSLGDIGIDLFDSLLVGLDNLQPYSSFLSSPNTNFGNATSAPSTDMYGVTWTGANPDAGCATYRVITSVPSTIGYVANLPVNTQATTITIAPGSTSQSIELYLGATGLTASTSGLSARYNRTRTASVSIPLVARTIAQAWTAGGFAEVDATNMPGVYRLDLPDAALAAGADDVTVVVRGASGTNGAVMTVKLSSGGLTEAQTASAVWGASPAGYNDATTFGGVVNEISNTVTGIDNEVQDIAGNVWDELRSGHTTVGTFGQYVNAELVTPVTSAALVRMGPFEVRADGLGASDPLDIQKGAQHGIDIQCVDNNGAGIDITSATVTAKVYNSGATLVDTYSCTATYAADGRATFTIDTTVTNVAGTYTATITRTTGASDTQIFGPLRIYVRDI